MSSLLPLFCIFAKIFKMSNYTINIQPTTRPTIVKFEANKFLTKHESFEFKNIDEASRSPLAQQLFHLPFVKTVFIAQNFVAIEKYNIVHWKDVQNEVAEQLSDYLNNGGVVISPSEDSDRKIPVTVYAETTPNPSVMKFASNKKLVLQAVEFRSIDETQNAPLAKELLQFPFIKQVFIDENYLSITKNELADWGEITNELREFIRLFLEDGKDVLTDDHVETSRTVEKAETVTLAPAIPLEGTSKEIVNILEEYVKPAVASDGGNIVFDSYDPDEKVVKVILQGACSGCPSSTYTLKNGIESMLKEMLQGKVEKVEAVNG